MSRTLLPPPFLFSPSPFWGEDFWVSLDKLARLSGLWLHPQFFQECQQEVGGGYSGRGGGGRARGWGPIKVKLGGQLGWCWGQSCL